MHMFTHCSFSPCTKCFKVFFFLPRKAVSLSLFSSVCRQSSLPPRGAVAGSSSSSRPPSRVTVSLEQSSKSLLEHSSPFLSLLDGTSSCCPSVFCQSLLFPRCSSQFALSLLFPYLIFFFFLFIFFLPPLSLFHATLSHAHTRLFYFFVFVVCAFTHTHRVCAFTLTHTHTRARALPRVLIIIIIIISSP